MPTTETIEKKSPRYKTKGATLVELIVFIVVISIAFAALIAVYIQSAKHSVDPIVRVRLLEAAQSRLDEIVALKYDEATPMGGIPACGSSDAQAIACDNASDSNMNDVDDFNGVADQPYPGYQRRVTVATDNDNNRKLITVYVTAPDGTVMTLATYRYNF